LHQVGDLFELNVKFRCQKLNTECLHVNYARILTSGHNNMADGRFPIHHPVLNEGVSTEVTHETGTRQIPVSNPARDNVYCNWAFSCSSSVPPG